MNEKINSRQIAIKLLENSPFIGEDYFKMEDFITDTLDGKNPKFPQVRGPEFYHVLQDVEDAMFRNFEYPDVTPETLEEIVETILNEVDSQGYDELVEEMVRKMGCELR